MCFVLLAILATASCQTQKNCSEFIDNQASITQLTNRSECFIGKRIETGGYVKIQQLGVFVYENPSDRQFSREENAIVMFKGSSTNKYLPMFENADYAEMDILYGGANSIHDIYSVSILTYKTTNSNN